MTTDMMTLREMIGFYLERDPGMGGEGEDVGEVALHRPRKADAERQLRGVQRPDAR